MWRSAFVFFLSGVLLAVLSASPASAAGRRGKKRARRQKNVRVVMLPVKTAGVPVDTARKLGKIVHDELEGIGIFRIVSGKVTVRKLAKLRRLGIYGSDCHENQRCIQAVGKSVSADVIYVMSLDKGEEQVELTMQTFDVRSGKELRLERETARQTDEALARATRWVVREASSPMITTLMKGKGHLQVNCKHEDAILVLNDKPFGKRTNKSFKVSPGVFDVVVKEEGFEPFREVVVVKPGEKREVVATLEESGPPALPEGIAASASRPPFMPPTTSQPVEHAPKPASATEETGDKFYQTWWFWTLVGAGVVGSVTAVTVVSLSGDGGGGTRTGGAVMTWE